MLDISKYASRDVQGLKPGTTILSSNGKYIYHISIIDYLQKYNFNKKAERFFKIALQGANPQELSSINVKAYHNRFLNFMNQKVFNYDFNHAVDICKLNQ
jgi:hypothetical protein